MLPYDVSGSYSTFLLKHIWHEKKMFYLIAYDIHPYVNQTVVFRIYLLLSHVDN